MYIDIHLNPCSPSYDCSPSYVSYIVGASQDVSASTRGVGRNRREGVVDNWK